MKHISTFESFTSLDSINESTEFKEYEKALTSHDWYYQMSDDSRKYDNGEREISGIKKIYAELSDDDKEKAFKLWTNLYKKFYPHSDYANKVKANGFTGY
jgi:hypothetical protein